MYFLVTAIAASFIPYLAFDFFDTPFAHGILCWDVLLVLVALCSPRLSKKGIVVCLSALVAYAVYERTLAGTVLAGFYALFLLVNLFLPRKKKAIVACFAVVGLVVVLAEANVFFYNTFRLYLVDVWGLASFFWWGALLFVLVPCLCVALPYFFARKVLWGKSQLVLTPVNCVILFLLLFAVHFGMGAMQMRQPLLSFPVKDAIDQKLLKGTESKSVILQQDAKETFALWNAADPVIDFDKPTLQILVESWGVNKRVDIVQKLFEPYRQENTLFLGLFLRESAYTQGAESEDFGVSGNSNPRLFSIPARFKAKGFQTWYVHGYDGNFYNRREGYGAYGFDSLYFKEEFVQNEFAQCKYGFTGICDSAMVRFLDSLMTDSVPKYIYWTTLDTHPPYEKSVAGSDCEEKENSVECIFSELQLNTAVQIAALARKHPEYRIVVRGDHRPMGALGPGFVSSFYYRWVPMVIFH